ncbi:phosphoglycerate mutase (2,3-diphosphoglycerate-dependent) [Malassezia furfur]|uniref:Phosphoglycerate mutase n=1 Tax=Malassezia furfur TaxID=55194 RepID=A0ABY8ELQ8_MALFU|nr:GPM1 [Malassezia furfur]WFD46483.1 phosphoglycerate mutase (2,3-diphosphoglycerate-dependent) [Malassezia furfur]
MVGTLVLTRHGQSEWNKKNLFTGWKDPDLTEQGREEALKGAEELKKYGYTNFNIAFTSALQRAQKTLDIQLKAIGQEGIPVVKDQALNERDYGELTGLNKDDARAKFGEEQVHTWRRSFDVRPPGGESLKLTADRVLPFFNKEIKPLVEKGESVLVAAHGNSLRAVIMALENMTPEQIISTELATGVPIVYKIDSDGKVVDKKILQ